MKQLNGTELKRLHRQWRKNEPPRLAILLEGLGGPYNVGAIVRTAAAYRVEHLYLAGMDIDLRSGSAAKTALGTDRYLDISHHEAFEAAAADARGAGFRLVGLELADHAVPMHHADFAEPTCLVIGHEDRGLSKTALADCDQVVFLPQLGKVGSLNVATATSIAIYEARRNAWPK